MGDRHLQTHHTLMALLSMQKEIDTCKSISFSFAPNKYIVRMQLVNGQIYAIKTWGGEHQQVLNYSPERIEGGGILN